MCDQYHETIDHLVPGCHVICPAKYKNRHDRVWWYMHWRICQHYNAPHTHTHIQKWYELVITGCCQKRMPLCYGTLQETLIEKLMPKNQITIKDHKSNSCLLIQLMFRMYKNLLARLKMNKCGILN